MYDLLGRQTQVTYPDGGSTSSCYTDLGGSTCAQSSTPPYAMVVNRALNTSGKFITSTTNFDGFGRVSQTVLNSDPQGADYVETTYDALGRESTVSSPHRSTSSTTDGITGYIFDALGRPCVTVQPDGTQLSQSSGCPTTAPSKDVFTQYSGNCTTVTDEAAKARQSCVDGLERLTKIFEDPNGLNYETDYFYDALNNLTCVEQHGGVTGTGCSSPPSSDATSPWRVRRFSYNSLSQLTSTTNQESGTISYTYDNIGNLQTKTAPSPNQSSIATVNTTYTHDGLKRLTGKSYNDTYTSNPATASVSYGYDGVALTSCTTAPPSDTDSYPVGSRTSMCDGSGATTWTHDKMGRILHERRTIGAVKGDFDNDTYNLDGSVTNVTSLGYDVAYTYDGAGRVTTAKNSADPFSYVTSATYAPPGEVASVSLGAAPITVTNYYNNRLQPILLSAFTSSATLFSECFDFHLGIAITPSQTPPCSFAASTSGDNGNVYQIVNNRDGNRTQNFNYDPLNRIQ